MKEFIEKLIGRLEEKFKYNSEQAEIYRDGSDKDAYFREKKDLYMDRANTYGEVMRIVNRLAEEFTKTPTPTHPIPIDTQQYIEKLEKRVNNKDWIPCSERLPEKNQRCLVSYKGNINSEGIEEKYVDIDRFEGTRFSFFGIDRVIAWQSLPAPYKEGE